MEKIKAFFKWYWSHKSITIPVTVGVIGLVVGLIIGC